MVFRIVIFVDGVALIVTVEFSVVITAFVILSVVGNVVMTFLREKGKVKSKYVIVMVNGGLVEISSVVIGVIVVAFVTFVVVLGVIVTFSGAVIVELVAIVRVVKVVGVVDKSLVVFDVVLKILDSDVVKLPGAVVGLMLRLIKLIEVNWVDWKLKVKSFVMKIKLNIVIVVVGVGITFTPPFKVLIDVL